MTLKRSLAVSSSVLTSTLGGWAGTVSYRPASKQPAQPVILYDMENCPYCRLVREVLTELDLDAAIRPCPKQGQRFRPKAKELGGKFLFPFLVDPNTGTQMYESADIIRYLAHTYEGRARSQRGLKRQVAVMRANLACAARPTRGYKVRASRAPEKPLELFSFESSPFSRLVREVLCELEIPYLLRNTGKGRWTDMGPPEVRDRWHKAPKDTGRNRKVLFERTGRVQVPYLIDQNTGTEMFESADIIAYLERTYAA